MIIFLDQDNVLVNFVLGASKLFNEDYRNLITRWTPGNYNMEDVIGVSRQEFLKTLENAGEKFWEELPAYPHAVDFYKYCSKLAPTYILTAPTDDPRCLSGKVKWFYRVFGEGFDAYIMTRHKEMCARSTHILIDDLASNVSKFKEHGGQAILWPTHFNIRHKESSNALDVVKHELDNLAKRIILNNAACQC